MRITLPCSIRNPSRIIQDEIVNTGCLGYTFIEFVIYTKFGFFFVRVCSTARSPVVVGFDFLISSTDFPVAEFIQRSREKFPVTFGIANHPFDIRSQTANIGNQRTTDFPQLGRGQVFYCLDCFTVYIKSALWYIIGIEKRKSKMLPVV